MKIFTVGKVKTEVFTVRTDAVVATGLIFFKVCSI